MGANLSEAYLDKANLSETILRGVNLGGAVLTRTNLYEALGWSIEQVDQAADLMGTIMPNGTQLGDGLYSGPSFDEWKTQYLANHGGNVEQQRDSFWAL